jgi:hypothetical protein
MGRGEPRPHVGRFLQLPFSHPHFLAKLNMVKIKIQLFFAKNKEKVEKER